jgi:zinc protease
VLLKGSRYADRLPIGKPEIIRSFTPDKLRRFYNDWYRPDLMAVMAVGDFDPAVVEGLIKQHFGGLRSPASPRARQSFPVPEQPGTDYAITTDPEATATAIGVVAKIPFRDQSTVGAYRQQMLERMFSAILNARFDELAQKPDAPFLAAQTNRSIFVKSAEATSLNAVVAEGGIERGLTALFTEADRVARFGFTATELQRQKLTLERFFEQAVTEREAEDSGALADEYIRNFNQGEPIPGIVYEYGLNKRFLPGITLNELNALAKTWTPDRSRVVLVSAPKKPGVAVPDAAKLATIIRAATGGPLTAYVDSVDTRPLLDPLPMPGKIVKTTTREGIGITEWELSNGVHVVLKPTPFKQDEILFRAVSPGGTSLARDADFVAAETADEVVAGGGLGRLSLNGLEKTLAGKNAFVRPEIGEMFEGLRGGASRKDLELMFQLVYLTFTQPRADPDAFKALTQQLLASLANRQALPEQAFEDTLNDAVAQGNLRAKPLDAAAITQMSLDKSLAFYRDRFADASDFTFVFVGSIDPQTLAPLVERYLGSLPAIQRKETGRDVGAHPPAGIVEKQVVKGIDPKGQVGVVFTGPFVNDPLHRVLVRAMAETLEGNLQQTLREDLGGTYGVGVRPEFKSGVTDEYRISIIFGCDPTRTDDLVKALFREIEKFRTTGPTRGQVADVQSALLRDFETNSRDNGYLLNQIAYKYQYGEDVADVFDMRALYQQVTPAAIRDAARMYLNTNRYVKVTLLPETQPK